MRGPSHPLLICNKIQKEAPGYVSQERSSPSQSRAVEMLYLIPSLPLAFTTSPLLPPRERTVLAHQQIFILYVRLRI